MSFTPKQNDGLWWYLRTYDPDVLSALACEPLSRSELLNAIREAAARLDSDSDYPPEIEVDESLARLVGRGQAALDDEHRFRLTERGFGMVEHLREIDQLLRPNDT